MLSLGHYKFRQRLIAKAQLVGCHVVQVHPDESYTTQGCTRCGHRQAMGGRRTYVCASCGLRIDRDINVQCAKHTAEDVVARGRATGPLKRVGVSRVLLLAELG